MFPLLPMILIGAGIGAALSLIEKDYQKPLTDGDNHTKVKNDEPDSQDDSHIDDGRGTGRDDSGADE